MITIAQVPPLQPWRSIHRGVINETKDKTWKTKWSFIDLFTAFWPLMHVYHMLTNNPSVYYSDFFLFNTLLFILFFELTRLICALKMCIAYRSSKQKENHLQQPISFHVKRLVLKQNRCAIFQRKCCMVCEIITNDRDTNFLNNFWRTLCQTRKQNSV